MHKLLFLSVFLGYTTAYASTVSHNHRRKKPAKIYSLYFTIDDGPLEGTPYLDSVFRKEQVPADLFLVGMHANINQTFRGYLNELRRDPWFELNNHSYTHAADQYDTYYIHPDTVLADMQRNRDSLHFKTHFCRMPARNMWRMGNVRFNDGFSGKETADLLKQRGYKVVGWDLEWESDSLGRPLQSPEQLFKEVERAFERDSSFTPGNIVVLCHDWMFIKPVYKQELQQFIELVKAAGNIRFKHLSCYPLHYRKKRALLSV